VVVGNLNTEEAKHIRSLGARYIDEDSVDLRGRMPSFEWEQKFRSKGWYKQMFLRLSIDRYMDTDNVVVLDSEVFVFDNWDESRLFDKTTNKLKSFYWVPDKRKDKWDYSMYRGAAYPLSFHPKFKGVKRYANSTQFKRHISGVVLFSRQAVEHLWEELGRHTDVKKNFYNLFNNQNELAFSDHDFYGIAVDYGLLDKWVKQKRELLGWYGVHNDRAFSAFKKDAMWSMCQEYANYPTPKAYLEFMQSTARALKQTLPKVDYLNKIATQSEKEKRKEYSTKMIVKKIGKRVLPSRYRDMVRKTIESLHRNEVRIIDIQKKLDRVVERVEVSDGRLDSIREVLSRVENYQPVYGIAGLGDAPARIESKERAMTIEQSILPVSGKRIIDFGSSLGYFSFYFADRGARVEGWESNADNCEASRRIADLNGVEVEFKVKELNLETISTIRSGYFDVALVLNVFHHIIRYQGLEETQLLVKEILKKVPILVVELAKKGEDPSLPWDASQPDDELAIFDLVRDEIDIHQIGEFGNHLSDKKRPMYVIQAQKIVSVGKRRYVYDTVTNQPYVGALIAHGGISRRYYYGKDIIVKEYSLDRRSRRENEAQILNEISILLQLKKEKIFGAPNIDSYEVNNDSILIALKKKPGTLLSDTREKYTFKQIQVYLRDVAHSLADLEAAGYYHNDIRSWNVLVHDNQARLIDYGLVSSKDSDNNVVAYMWLAAAMITGKREQKSQRKQTLPPAKVFSGSKKLTGLYRLTAVTSGDGRANFKDIYEYLSR